MGTTIYRVTGIGLSITIALLGTGAAILLYHAGKAAVDFFYTDSTYLDEYMRINRRMPTDDWYGVLILRGWALGFVYIVPGLSGIAASLFFNKCLMMIHITIAIMAIFVGSFMHTCGGIALLLYRLLIGVEIVRYDPFLGDCVYYRDNPLLPHEYVDEKCLTGRRTLQLSVAAVGVVFIAWIFVLANVLYIGFTFHNIGKDKKKQNIEETNRTRRRSPKRRRKIPTEQETLHHTNTATTEDTGNGENMVKPDETQEGPSSIAAEIEQTNENVQNENSHVNDAFEDHELNNSRKTPTEDDDATKNEKDQDLVTTM